MMHKNKIDELSAQWIHYYTSDEQIEQFKQLAARFQSFINKLFDNKYPDINMNIPICNVWFALHRHQPNKPPLFLNEQLRMTYAAGYFQLEYVERHKAIELFVTEKNMTDDETIIFATHLVYELTDWLDTIVKKANETKIFDLYNAQTKLEEYSPDDEQFDQSQHSQKMFMYLIAKNLEETHDLEKAMLRAISKTQKSLYFAANEIF